MRWQGSRTRAVSEAALAAAIASALALIVFGPVLKWVATGWAGGDMLSTYVNAEVWQGFKYRITDQFGFPLGMNLNYFPGIDITENTFAHVVSLITGKPFLGINLLILMSFPVTAFLTYFLFRMTRLTGPLAIAGAVVFSLLPYHFGRALGHVYLSTLYSAVTGLALVLLIGSGRLEQLFTVIRKGRSSTRILLLVALGALIVVTAWTGIYYVAFTLILGVAALLWRFAKRARWRSLVMDAVPLALVAVLAVVGFLPSITATAADPPLAKLSERLPYESVVFAGNLAVAILPVPQSNLPGLDAYNSAVVEAIAAGGWGEATKPANYGTWITLLALVTVIGGLIGRARRGPPAVPERGRYVTLPFVSYLIVVTLLWFVPWGLNYLFAGTVTAQIRAWNRLTPVLLLLFLLGAAAALHRTRVASNLRYSLPIAVGVLALTAVDTVLPFRGAYTASVREGAGLTKAARAYAIDVNEAIPNRCGVLQLPSMEYPEFGVARGVNDYDHFWTSLTNPDKAWSYGSVKSTDAGIWGSQLAELPTDEQVANMVAGGFCAIHFDTRAYISERLPDLTGNLSGRFGPPVALGNDDKWLLFDIRNVDPSTPQSADRYFHQPMVRADAVTTQPREIDAENYWWWMKSPRSEFTLTSTGEAHPVTSVQGEVQAPVCGPRPVTVVLAAEGSDEPVSVSVIATPDTPTPFQLTLPGAGAAVATVEVQADGGDCQDNSFQWKRYAQVLNMRAY